MKYTNLLGEEIDTDEERKKHLKINPMVMSRIAYLLASMALVIAFLIWRLSVVNRKLDSSNSALTEKSDSIRYFRSESGKQVAVKSAAEITKADLKEHYQDIEANLRDMKIKLNSVRAVLKAVVQSQGQGVVTIVHDTIRVAGVAPVVLDSILIDDSFLRLSGRLHNSEFRYKYSYSDTIVMSISGKKRWLFGKETLIGSARLSNPNARAVSQTSILIKGARDRRFVLSAGLNYNPFTNTFAPGIHAGYALIKF